eukprot:gene19153-24994_t
MGCQTSTIKEELNVFQDELKDVDFHEQETILSNGSKRNVLNWKPVSDIKGIVVLVHGLHEHALRYANFAKILTEHNYIVFGMDALGHGLSEGVRGLINDFRVLASDLVSLITYIRSNEKLSTLPLFIFSHSLGTLITIKALKDLTDIAAIVFSGTPIFPGFGSASPFGLKFLYPIAISSLGIPIIYLTSSLTPLGPAGPVVESELAYNEDVINKARIDGRHYKGEIRNRTAYETLVVTKEVKELVKSITLPILVIHGKDDNISLHKGSEYIYENAATEADKKTLIIIPNSKHEIIFEKDPVGIDTIAQIVNFYDSFITTNGDDIKIIRASSFKIK